jgi:hypothetical protein
MMNYLIYGRGKARQGKARQGKARQGKERQGKHVLRSIYKDRLLVLQAIGLGRS